MSFTYKAFISYRHKTLDSSVAVKVQRTIEHYTVPKDLRDLTGGKKIGKVFRDEDELPLSSSLSDSIVRALDDSEFLIVICTPDLLLSKWCEQEIRHFLSTHDRDHIITVLASGSSDESFSPLLLHKYDEEGNITGDIEPLAANIVADTDRKRWKLFAKEKFRVLAALIGCAFDELYQREQRYKRRRALAFGSVTAAVVLSFIGLLINRNAVIRKNYEQALRNQSVYLASESQRLLGEGDRLSSIALAIEALPSEENDRPLVSKAEYALARSTYAYETDWYRNRRSNYVINNALKHSDDVVSFMLSEKGDLIVSLTRDNNVTAWNAEKNIRKWTTQVEDYHYAGLVDVLSDNTVVIYDGGSVIFLDCQSGNVAYELEAWEGRSYAAITDVLASKDHGVFAVTGYSGVKVYGTDSKEEICGIECTDNIMLEALSFSEDGNMIAVGYYQGLGSYHGYEGIRVYDTESGDMIADLDSFSADYLYWLDVLFAEDNRLCVSYAPYYLDISGTTGSVSFMFFAERNHYLSLYDIASGERIWEVASKYNSTNANHMTLATESLAEETVFVNVYSSFVDIVDAKSGNILSHAEYPSVVVHAAVYDDAVQCITADGGFGGLKSGAEGWSLVQSFVSDLKSVIYDESDYWMVQNGSDSILHYGYVNRDTSWIGIKDNIPSDTERSNFNNSWSVSDKDSFVIGSSNWKEFLYFDPEINELTYKAFSETHAETESTYRNKVIRLKDGMLSILKCPSAGALELWNINMLTDDRNIFLQIEDGIEFIDVIGDSAMEEWYGIAFCHNENWESGYYFVSFDYEFNLKNKTLIKPDPSSVGTTYVGKYFDKDGSVYVKFPGADETYVIDLRDFTVQECSGAMREVLASVVYSEMEGRMDHDLHTHITAISTGGRTVLFDKNRTVIGEIVDGSSDIISVSFAENSKCILTLCKDNQLRRYDSKTGELLSRCDIDYDCSYVSPEYVNWIETDKDFTILMLRDRGSLLISESDWDISAVVPRCTAYLPSGDFFVLIPSDFENCESGGFKRHTIESLTEYGREILGEWELSETQRMQYGIE